MSDTMFPEPMDQMDRAMQRMDKKAWAEADAEIALLKARLAEADALIAKGLVVVHDFLPNIGRCVLQDYQRMIEFCSEAAARTAVSAVQPERCCVDYPRCDCNSPPEPEGAE